VSRALALAAAFVLALAGCGEHYAAPEAQPEAAAPAAPAAKQKTVFDDSLRALDKAKAVEKQLKEQKDAQDQAMDAQERGG
jgi:hypothetical protein